MSKESIFTNFHDSETTPPIRFSMNELQMKEIPVSQEEWFRFQLENPATPSFCTCAKDFWGDEASITAYLKKCGKTDVPLKPCRLIRRQTVQMESKFWYHPNIWGSAYHMWADHITVEQALLEADGCYFLCIRPVFHDLSYDNTWAGGYISVPARFWGNPHMIEKVGDDYIASLFTTQERFSNEKEGLEMMGDPSQIRFSSVCDEIFGDG